MLQLSSLSFATGADVEIAGSNVQFISSVSFNNTSTLYLTRGATLDFNNAVTFTNRETPLIFGDAGCRVTGKITSSIGGDWNPFGVRDYAEAQGVVVRVGKNAGYKDVAEWRLPEPKAVCRKYIHEITSVIASPGYNKIYELPELDVFKDMSKVISVRVIRANTFTGAGSYSTFEVINEITGYLDPAGTQANSEWDCVMFYNFMGWSGTTIPIYIVVDYVE
jgi:hypothetical protein